MIKRKLETTDDKDKPRKKKLVIEIQPETTGDKDKTRKTGDKDKLETTGDKDKTGNLVIR